MGITSTATPVTLAEVEGRIATLRLDIDSIQNQLGKKRPARGTKPHRGYHDWRRKALHALRSRVKALDELKAWKRERLATRICGPEGELLQGSYKIIKRLLSSGVAELTTEEQELVNDIQAKLRVL